MLSIVLMISSMCIMNIRFEIWIIRTYSAMQPAPVVTGNLSEKEITTDFFVFSYNKVRLDKMMILI
jgi:hypothetical protein